MTVSIETVPPICFRPFNRSQSERLVNYLSNMTKKRETEDVQMDESFSVTAHAMKRSFSCWSASPRLNQYFHCTRCRPIRYWQATTEGDHLLSIGDASYATEKSQRQKLTALTAHMVNQLGCIISLSRKQDTLNSKIKQFQCFKQYSFIIMDVITFLKPIIIQSITKKSI